MAFAPATWPTVWRSNRMPPRWLLLLLLLIIAALGAAWAYMNGYIGQRETPITYQTTPVTRGNVVQAVTATGPISSPASLPLTFKNAGRLSELDVQVGDKV